MTEIVLSEDPELGSGAAESPAAELPVVRSHIDAYADEALPNHNFGDRVKLKLNGGGGSDTALAYIFFARPFPYDATILEATLKVYLAGTWSGSQDLTAKRITERWKEGQLTWDDRPAVSDVNLSTVTVASGVADQEIEMPLTAMLADVAAGDEWFGVRLGIDDNVDRKLWSSENPDATLRPVLELDWLEPPHPPSNLHPGGGRAISLESPVLNWRFKDPEDEGQASSQVQIFTSDDFTDTLFDNEDDDAPSGGYDSGKVANTLSEWDLGETAFTIADDATVFWRVRVWDEGDLPSEWSDVEEFQRKTKGALEIVNPGEAPDDYVEETTPPLDWTFTGRTQESASVRLWRLDADDGTPENLIEAWHVEEETSVKPEKNQIKSGRLYRLIVRVWDHFDREVLPGDPTYVEATREFTYERSGTPSAVTTLTATPVANEPRVTLHWERATEPDYFSLRIDDEEVEQRIDPEDVLVSAGVYEMEWWLASPREEHTYEVEAVVHDSGKLKHSGSDEDPNATATATTEPTGIWLVDPDDNVNVEIRGPDDPDFSIREVGTTHDLIGQRKPVRITDSVGGYAGSVSGILRSEANRDRLLRLKGRLGVVRLILADLSLPVRMEEISVSPRPDLQGHFNVSVAFFQTSDFTFNVTGG